MKLIAAIAFSAAIFVTATGHAQKPIDPRKKPSPQQKAQEAKPKAEAKPQASVPAPKVDPIPDAYSCSVVVIDPVTKETSSISKTGVQGYNEVLARQNCVNELRGQVTIADGKKVFTVERPADGARVEAGPVQVEKMVPGAPAGSESSTAMELPNIPKEVVPPKEPPRPKYRDANAFCAKISKGDVGSALRLKPATDVESQLKELSESGFSLTMSRQSILAAPSLDDRMIPIGAVLVLEKKAGSGCPISEAGKPVLVAKCSHTHITWPNGISRKLEDFLKENKNCVASVAVNKSYPKVPSGHRVGPPTPAPAATGR